MKKGIVGVISAIAGGIAGATAIRRTLKKTIDEKQLLAEKHLALFLLMNQWIKVKQEGKTLDSYFLESSYKKIAIYGLSYIGETLIQELKDTEVKIVYGIDKNISSIYADMEIYSPEDCLPEVDAIIVSAVYFFNEIEEKLSEKVKCPIISLEDILYEV